MEVNVLVAVTYLRCWPLGANICLCTVRKIVEGKHKAHISLEPPRCRRNAWLGSTGRQARLPGTSGDMFWFQNIVNWKYNDTVYNGPIYNDISNKGKFQTYQAKDLQANEMKVGWVSCLWTCPSGLSTGCSLLDGARTSTVLGTARARQMCVANCSHRAPNFGHSTRKRHVSILRNVSTLGVSHVYSVI